MRVLKRLGVPGNKKFLNGHCGGAGYEMSIQASKANSNTKVVWVISEEVHRRVSLDDPILLTDEVGPQRKISKTPRPKRIVTEEERQRMSNKMRGMVSALDISTGEYKHVSRKEFEETDNLVGVNFNKKLTFTKERSQEHKNKISASRKDKVTVIDLSSGKKIQITKLEFDANRDKYCGHTKGMFPAKDKFGNRYYVSNQDPRYLSGDLVHAKSKRFD